MNKSSLTEEEYYKMRVLSLEEAKEVSERWPKDGMHNWMKQMKRDWLDHANIVDEKPVEEVEKELELDTLDIMTNMKD